MTLPGLPAHELPPGTQLVYGGPEIAAAVYRIGREIRRVYGQEELTIVCVLHGAIVFCADVMRQLDMPIRLETVSAHSYRGEATTPGELEVKLDFSKPIRDRHVLLVEDILDTGRTLARLKADMQSLGPKSLRMACLLDKPSRRIAPIEADFVGFQIPDLFVVGYGLDFDGRYRNLPDVMALSPEMGEG